MKSVTLLVWVLCCHGLYAQSSNKSLVNDLVGHWQASKKLVLAVAEAVPADAYRPFKPSDREWNFGDEIGGLALANVLSCSLATRSKAPASFQSALDHPMEHTKAATLDSLKTAYDYCIDGLTKMDDASLFEMTAYGGHQSSRFDIYWNALAHATHRLGQAEMFMRSRGIEPPDTGPRYQF